MGVLSVCVLVYLVLRAQSRVYHPRLPGTVLQYVSLTKVFAKLVAVTHMNCLIQQARCGDSGSRDLVT